MYAIRSYYALVLVLAAPFLLGAGPGQAPTRKAAPAAKAEAFDHAAVIKQLKIRNIGP